MKDHIPTTTSNLHLNFILNKSMLFTQNTVFSVEVTGLQVVPIMQILFLQKKKFPLKQIVQKHAMHIQSKSLKQPRCFTDSQGYFGKCYWLFPHACFIHGCLAGTQMDTAVAISEADTGI